MNYQNVFLMSFGVLMLLLSIVLDEDQLEDPRQGSPTYSELDTRPYGAKAVPLMLQDLFPEKEVKIIRKSLYEVLIEEETKKMNYVFIDQSCTFQQLDAATLVEFVSEGGTVLIAAQKFKGLIADTLELNTENFGSDVQEANALYFKNLDGRSKNGFVFQKETAHYYFNAYNDKEAEVLAENQLNKAVLLRQKFGEGFFYLSSTPLAFTNYNLLWAGNNHQFIESTFANLPQQDLYWDEYYKTGRGEAQSPFRFIMSRRSLRTAFYLGILGVLILVVFEGQRRQRVVPILPVIKNDTLNFVSVIGMMYFNAKAHTQIAHKKIKFFREFLRQQHLIKEEQPSKESLDKLALKTNTPFEKVVQLFKLMQTLEQQKSITEKELQALNTLIYTLRNLG